VTARWWETGLAVALLAALQLAVVFNPTIVEVDPEEMYNAGQAWQMLDCHFGDTFLLQYRDFCGGCTLDALLGMGVFTLFGRSWLAWKLVPLLFLLGIAVLGSRTLHRIAGRPAAWAFLALLLLPPRTWLFLSSIAWGNHYEAGCLALAGLTLLLGAQSRPRAALAGALLGLAVWTGFSASFAVVAAIGWMLVVRRAHLLPGLLSGVALGLLPWALQWFSSGLHPFVTVYESSEAGPSLSRIPYKLGTLLRPRQLVALFGLPTPGLGWWLGWLWAVSLAAALSWLAGLARREGRNSPAGRAALAILLFGGAWLAMYCVVRFQIHDPLAPEIAYPTSARYAAPLYPLAFLALALAVGTCWSAGRRSLCALLLAAPLLAGLLARGESFQPPYPAPSVSRLEAVDWEFFRPGFGTRLTTDAIASCRSEDLRTRQLQAYALGREAAATQLRQQGPSLAGLVAPEYEQRLSWWQGVGEAATRHLQEEASAEPADSLLLLRKTEATLKSLPAEPDEYRVGLRAAASLSYATGIDWRKVQGGWDQESLARIQRQLQGVPATISEAGWWAHGLACGRALATFHQPESLLLPAGLEKTPTVFFEGLGTALGERWGPLASLPRPRGLPLHAGRALSSGYQQGVARRWLDSQDLPAPQLPLP